LAIGWIAVGLGGYVQSHFAEGRSLRAFVAYCCWSPFFFSSIDVALV